MTGVPTVDHGLTGLRMAADPVVRVPRAKTAGRPCRDRDERGSAALELVVLIPALALILGAMIAGGRLWFARTDVNEAAYAAARAGSLARTAEQASADGRRAGAEALVTRGLSCVSTAVTVDTRAFRISVGLPASVGADVRCRVPLSDLLVPGLPGSVLVIGEAQAALDTYRSRS